MQRRNPGQSNQQKRKFEQKPKEIVAAPPPPLFIGSGHDSNIERLAGHTKSKTPIKPTPMEVEIQSTQKQFDYRPTSPTFNPITENVETTVPEAKLEVKEIIKQNPREVKKDQPQKQPRQPQANYERNWLTNLQRLMKFWYPFRLKLDYPRKSALSSFEQKEFIEFHNKFKSRSKVTQAEVKFFKKYMVNKRSIPFFKLFLYFLK
jgi:hypothetical protein